MKIKDLIPFGYVLKQNHSWYDQRGLFVNTQVYFREKDGSTMTIQITKTPETVQGEVVNEETE